MFTVYHCSICSHRPNLPTNKYTFNNIPNTFSYSHLRNRSRKSIFLIICNESDIEHFFFTDFQIFLKSFRLISLNLYTWRSSAGSCSVGCWIFKLLWSPAGALVSSGSAGVCSSVGSLDPPLVNLASPLVSGCFST